MGAMPYCSVPTRHIGRYERLPRASSRSQRKHPGHEAARAARRLRPRRNKRDGKVQEMVQSNRDCSTRGGADDIKFQSFCVFVAGLKKKVPPPPVISCQQERPGSRLPCKLSPAGCGKYEVFLGGSCNPTTWRMDEAIPRLKELGISYYNPQVAAWHPSMIAQEEEAKQSAAVLFFVIDNQTRAIASMLEASYLAASGRKLVLVVSRRSDSQPICGEPITNTEYCELNRTQNYLQDLMERQGVPVFESIASALDCTDKVLRHDMRLQDLRLDDNVVPVRNAHITLADKLHKLREVFNSEDTEGRDSLSLAEACTALRIVTGHNVGPSDVKSLLAHFRDVTEQLASEPAPEGRVSFEDLCLLAAELQSSSRRPSRGRTSPSVLSRTAEVVHQLLTPLTRVAEWVLPQRLARQLSNGNGAPPAADVRDVYLGGTMSATSWRQNVAAPALKKAGLTFDQPASLEERLTPTEAGRMERCRHLLFVITDTSRAPAHLTMAAHYIGLGARVVLCIQMLPDNCVIQGEKLTATAIKDYNRGRSYLADLAARKGVPVFDSVSEAVQKVVTLSQARRAAR